MTDIKNRECPQCAGSGEIDPEDHLDLDSIEAIRAELLDIVTTTGDHSLWGSNRANRILYASKVAWLASRLNWLESSAMFREEWKAKMAEPITGNACPECRQPRTLNVDDEHGRVWLCLNDACPVDC